MKDEFIVPDDCINITWRGKRIQLVQDTVKLYQWLYFDPVECEYMISRHRQSKPTSTAKRLDHTMIEVEV